MLSRPKIRIYYVQISYINFFISIFSNIQTIINRKSGFSSSVMTAYYCYTIVVFTHQIILTNYQYLKYNIFNNFFKFFLLKNNLLIIKFILIMSNLIYLEITIKNKIYCLKILIKPILYNKTLF